MTALTPQEQGEMGAKISQEDVPSSTEVMECMNLLPSGKSPGADGFGKESVVLLWPVVGELYFLAFLEYWESGSLLPQFKDGLLFLLPKTEDPETLSHWRPITMLNTVYKVFAKLMACRMALILPDVVPPQQQGFVKSRSTQNCILHFALVHEALKKEKRSALFFTLDQEKAYDRLLPDFLWETMAILGFSEKIVVLLRGLQEEAETRILLNGTLLPSFKVGKGVRQGCPLSPLLFVLATIPLIDRIHFENHRGGIKPVKLGDSVMASLICLADDTAIFSEIDQRSTDVLFHTLGILEVAAEARVNKTKSKILLIGKTVPFPPWLNSHGLVLVDPRQSIVYLGALALTERRRVDDSQRVLDRISRSVQRYSASRLSLEGRVVALKGGVFPALIYPLMTASFKKSTFKKLDSILRRFVWAVNAEGNQKTALVAWPLLAQPTNSGGLGIFDLQNFQKALMCRVIFRTLADPEGSLWAPVLADRFLGVSPPELGKALCLKLLPGASRLGPVASLLIRSWEDFTSTVRWFPPQLPYVPGGDIRSGCYTIARQWAGVKEAATVAANIDRWASELGLQSLIEIKQRPLLIRLRINGLTSDADMRVMGFILDEDFRLGEQAWNGVEWRSEETGRDLSDAWRATDVYTVIRGKTANDVVMNERLQLSWSQQEWRAIWSLTNIKGLSRKHRTFLWRTLTDAFLTGNREKRMGFDTFSCSYCGGGVEDFTHAVLTCPRWRDFWSTMSTKVEGWREIRNLVNDFKSPAQILKWVVVLAGQDKLFTAWFLAITWRVFWAERCTLRYEGKLNTVASCRVTLQFLEELYSRRSLLKDEVVKVFARRLLDVLPVKPPRYLTLA
ncbi:hypothetical protein R1sor_014324 [Riccia sorocarpa]|uniref:Reverse transcriptase domain-containing protein n=1 Tax=Riccia sorocarpa TaxID=122646 RepID=A0ABD3HC93_9MARC